MNMNIVSKNLLAFIIEYFKSIGLEAAAMAHFNAQNFESAVTIPLSEVCIVPENKSPDSKSKQTHIHITGEKRYFFFPRAQVDSPSPSGVDVRQELHVSMQNIHALREGSSAYTSDSADLELKETHTMIKVGGRKWQDSQVQISKLRLDGKEFMAMRNALYSGDLLIFLKYRNSDRMMAIGIPHAYHRGNTFQKEIYKGLESTDAVPVQSVLAGIAGTVRKTDVVQSGERIADAVYQELVDTAEPSHTTYDPVKYEASEGAKMQEYTRPQTNPALGKEVLCEAHFRCAMDAFHPTFLKKDGTPYMEVHHLIPLKQQGKFENKLDTKANLVPLCPLCHRRIHYGTPEDISTMLERLYKEHSELLVQSGIPVSLEELVQYYK